MYCNILLSAQFQSCISSRKITKTSLFRQVTALRLTLNAALIPYIRQSPESHYLTIFNEKKTILADKNNLFINIACWYFSTL
jgi:hypothetical protein